MVLNHDDLFEMNIHVDEDTGRITGIVDWADAKVARFGTSLRGLETVLGIQASSHWHYHSSHDYLRMQFWETTFYEAVGDISEIDRRAIKVGRVIGLFRANGFDRQPDQDDAVPVEEGHQQLACLEAYRLR